MDASVVGVGGHRAAVDDAGDIPTIDEEEDSLPSSHISNTFVHLPSSQDGGVNRELVQGEEQNVRRRHVRQDNTKQTAEVCDPSRLVLLEGTSCIEDTAKSPGQETEGIGTKVIPTDHQNPEDWRTEETREIRDVGDKVNSVCDDCSTQSAHDKPTHFSTHTFSFSLVNKNKDKESICDTESESQLSVSQISSSETCLVSDLTGVKVKTKTKKQKTHKIGKDGRDSDSSVSSKKKGSSSKPRIKSKFTPGSLEYIEQGLRGRIFSGWVGERRWVESLHAYRDVIEVDEWEVEMNQQLKAIISSIPGVYEGTKWINLTPPSENECYSLWVLLAAPPTPGHYWYTVTGIQLEPLFGLRILVKEIRKIHPHDGEEADARQRRQKKLSSSGTSKELQSFGEQLQEWVEQARQLNLFVIWSALRSTITIRNIKETFRFLVVLVMTVVIGFASFLRESHHLGLRFVREAGIFFHHITPFLQTLLSFVEKLIGGMYLLLAMIYRDWRRPSVPPPSYPPRSQPPLSLTQGQSPIPTLPPSEPRVLKYVPPQQWVFRNQNSGSSPS